ncbi:MAG: class I SAM-dependent methyltransferase [Limisphaerales bacterium]
MNTEQSRKPAARLKLRVSAAAEAALREGHPWVFADAIREQSRPGETGELAVVYDRQDRFLAVGLFDADSPIRLRALQAGRPEPIDAGWWAGRLEQALERRRGLFDDQTTGYRWIHGENDGWPGLVLDRYDGTLVLKLYTAAWLPRLDQIAALVIERLRPERVVLRLSRNVREIAANRFSRTDGDPLRGAAPAGPVVFLESGLRFEADVLRGQKTGFFLDQRENRRRVEGLARGRRVLNAFSYSGAFSLYAARGGASSVTDLDVSEQALAGAERNFALNQGNGAVASCGRESVRAEAFEWLGASAENRFDLIILDPPSLARRQAEQAGAIRAYERLAGLGLGRLAPGGILAACSCSAHVSAEQFFAAARKAAARSGRPIRELQTTGHPPDHPAVFREAHYLKAIFFELRTGC